MENSVRIIQGDCIEEMATLVEQDKKFNLIVADPPYNQGVNYGEGVAGDSRSHHDYIEWCTEWVDEAALNLLTENGSMWLIIPWHHSAMFTTIGRRAGLILRNVIIWHETFGQYSQTNFGNCHRHLLYFTRSTLNFTFNAGAVRIESERQRMGDKRADPRGKVMTNVWEIPRIVGNSKERIPEVPNQLPRALLRPIVNGCTNPGDSVLDPFCGSGTTGVEAVWALCGFTGIEINKDYADLAERRINEISR